MHQLPSDVARSKNRPIRCLESFSQKLTTTDVLSNQQVRLYCFSTHYFESRKPGQKSVMSPPDSATIVNLLTNGPHRTEVGHKQLTLAFGGLYIASTTTSAKPYLVWEAEKGYPRYYIPSESLHADIKSRLKDADSGSIRQNGHKAPEGPVDLIEVETVNGKGNKSQAFIERLTVGCRTTTWVRFVEGPLKGLIRFERSEIGRLTTSITFSFH